MDSIHVHLKIQTHAAFLMKYIKPIINLKTFNEGLNNKKHVQILKSFKRTLLTSVLHMTKDFNNIVKRLQIHRSPIS
jgi:hypothetical protein